MQTIFQNKYVKFGSLGLVGMTILIVVISFINLSNQNIDISADSLSNYPSVSTGRSTADSESYSGNKMTESSDYYYPEPGPIAYTEDLEKYETSSCNITARTRKFDELCQTIENLKMILRFILKILIHQPITVMQYFM